MERVAENSRQLIFVADYRVLVVVCTRVFFSVRHPFEICQPTTPSSFSFSLIWYSHSRNVSAELKDEEEGSLLPPPLSRELSDPLDDDAHMISASAR